MFSFVQAMHSDKDAMTPICAGELYHGRYNASCLAAEVRLGLQSASLVPGQISAQHAHTIAIHNDYIDEVTQIWALELAACCVWLLGTTSKRTRREIFITKDLRFEASLELAFRARLRAHTLISWNTR
ncbi:hypothetical protein DSO57_1020862 [Entomophthora muscae]|uniref:Uncharacterized protein n=1 Tax=Entomophthora muscae TaxID=34485 RepID=A0ACC2RIA2_9FUNG|nr:hypothetical protein DSO57_1020862 [Entomophthora muscae]